MRDKALVQEVGVGTDDRRGPDLFTIDAKLADGVLRLELPKLERAKPRQITVRTG